MSTIDEIIGMVQSFAQASVEFDRDSRQSSDDRRQSIGEDMRDLIAAAIADAKREGAEQMREASAALCRQAAVRLENAAQASEAEEPEEVSALRATAWKLLLAHDDIRAIPLPTGQRQAVRLTDEEVIREICLIGRRVQRPDGAKQLCRAIETAVLAANGLEGGAA